jgi:hypothetical protein
MPKTLMVRRLTSKNTGTVAAYGALTVGTRIHMDEDVCRALKMLLEDVFQLLDSMVAFIQGQIPRHDQVKIDMDAISGTPGAKFVHINPMVLAVFREDPRNFLQQAWVRLVHQPRETVAPASSP